MSGGAMSDSTIGDGAATATMIGAAAGGGVGELPNLHLDRRTPGLHAGGGDLGHAHAPTLRLELIDYPQGPIGEA
jgi:hypothetical protein